MRDFLLLKGGEMALPGIGRKLNNSYDNNVCYLCGDYILSTADFSSEHMIPKTRRSMFTHPEVLKKIAKDEYMEESDAELIAIQIHNALVFNPINIVASHTWCNGAEKGASTTIEYLRWKSLDLKRNYQKPEIKSPLMENPYIVSLVNRPVEIFDFGNVVANTGEYKKYNAAWKETGYKASYSQNECYICNQIIDVQSIDRGTMTHISEKYGYQKLRFHKSCANEKGGLSLEEFKEWKSLDILRRHYVKIVHEKIAGRDYFSALYKTEHPLLNKILSVSASLGL